MYVAHRATRWSDNLASSDNTDGFMLVMLNFTVMAATLLTADGIIFAPLGHVWLQTMSRISFPSTLKSKSRLKTVMSKADSKAVSVRMVLDSFLWSPFVCCRKSPLLP